MHSLVNLMNTAAEHVDATPTRVLLVALTEEQGCR